MGQLSQYIINLMDNLEKIGFKNITKSDRNLSICLICFFYIIVFTLPFLIFDKSYIPLFLISGMLLSFVVFFISIFISGKSFDNVLLFTGILSLIIPIMIISIWITIKITPYRGNNPLMLRTHKIKYLIRKSKYNKLKFWK